MSAPLKTNLLPDRETVAEIRALRHKGVSVRGIYNRGFSASLTQRVCKDVDAGGHDLDPVDDEVAVQRVVETGCGDTWQRLSVWEQRRVLDELMERARFEDAMFGTPLEPSWRDRYAQGFGYKDWASVMRGGNRRARGLSA